MYVCVCMSVHVFEAIEFYIHIRWSARAIIHSKDAEASYHDITCHAGLVMRLAMQWVLIWCNWDVQMYGYALHHNFVEPWQCMTVS